MLRKVLLLVSMLPLGLFAQEVCNNGIDDDGDGLIDLNDPDCPCSMVINTTNTPSFIPNPSFEQRTCCPTSFVSIFSYPYMDCATGWHQATSATSDYFHTCGFAPSQFPLPPPDGDGCVGFYAMPGYREYVGQNIYFTPLNVGTDYTLSLWIAGLSMSDNLYGGQMWNGGVYYEGQLPLAIYGNPNAIPFPMATDVCSSDPGGWVELARVYYQPNGQWTNVSMTFTPPFQIRSVMIGGACDVPSTYVGTSIGPGNGINIAGPYFLVDDLHLTESVDQAVLPVVQQGTVCANDVVVSGTPPAAAQGYQWYLDGVALVGQNATSLSASALGLEGGTYTLSSTFDGQCLMGNTNVVDGSRPLPAFELDPVEGCSPLEVSFMDTTAGQIISTHWTFGDNSSGDGIYTHHTYTAPGSYDVTISVTTTEGCTTDSTLVDAVHVFPAAPTATITATPNPTDIAHTAVTVSGNTGNGIVAWWWDLGAVPPNAATGADVLVNFPAEPGSYPVMLVVSNASGCVDTVRSFIVITLAGDVEMPNVFSPNGDGQNDTFIPLNYTGAEGTLKIYNRWGQVVYVTSALGRGWDGRADGGPVPAGTYYYIVEPAEGNEPSAGHFTLIR